MFVIFLIGCDQPTTLKEHKNAYLLPQLQHSQIQSIEIKSELDKTKIVKKLDTWWLDKPIDYLAQPTTVESLLQNLIDATPGKPINITPSEYALLNLTLDTGAILITLNLANNSSIKLYFGKLDFPKNSEAGELFGLGYTARRYIRVVTDTSDTVHLTRISIVDLTASAEFWTDNHFIRIPSFKKATLLTDNKREHVFYRSFPFGQLSYYSSDKPHTKLDSTAFLCFETFLKTGRCAKVGTHNQGKKSLKNSSLITHILIEDFLGTKYKFDLGKEIKPSQADIDRAALQAGLLSNGMAPSLVPFKFKSWGEKRSSLAPTETLLYQQNLKLAHTLNERTLFMEKRNVACLYNLLERLK